MCVYTRSKWFNSMTWIAWTVKVCQLIVAFVCMQIANSILNLVYIQIRHSQRLHSKLFTVIRPKCIVYILNLVEMNVALQICLCDCPYTVHIAYKHKYPPKRLWNRLSVNSNVPKSCEHSQKSTLDHGIVPNCVYHAKYLWTLNVLTFSQTYVDCLSKHFPFIA